MAEPLIVALLGNSPEIHPESWVAPNAAVLGNVTLGEKASIWYSATVRAEFEPIVIGAVTNIQDSVTIDGYHLVKKYEEQLRDSIRYLFPSSFM